MSFLGEGLQLVVTPAVLSVAVPGMFHHLDQRKTEQCVIRRVNYETKHSATNRETDMTVENNGSVERAE